MPTRRSGKGRQAHPKVREESGGPPGGLEGGVRRPTRRSKRGREAHFDVWKGAGGPPGG